MTVAFNILGDWTWTGSSTLTGPIQSITSTTGDLTLAATLGNINLTSGAITTVNANTLNLNSVNNITLTSSLHGIVLNAHTSIDIECGPLTSGYTLNIGKNASTLTTIGNSTSGVLDLIGSQVYLAASGTTFIGGQSTTSTSTLTSIYGNSIQLGAATGSDITALAIGQAVTAWTCRGTSLDASAFSSQIAIDTTSTMIIGTISTTAITLGHTSGNVTVNAATLHLNAGSGNAYLDSASGSIFIGSVGAPAAINIGQGLTGKPTIIQGGLTQIFGTDSLEMDSVLINFADISCTALNIGSSICVTKLILPTPAIINNTPLLIDTDGRIHV